MDSRNNIMVPGFYNGVRPNTLGAALQRLDTCHEFSLEGYREALGIPKLASAANMRSAVLSFVVVLPDVCFTNALKMNSSLQHKAKQKKSCPAWLPWQQTSSTSSFYAATMLFIRIWRHVRYQASHTATSKPDIERYYRHLKLKQLHHPNVLLNTHHPES